LTEYEPVSVRDILIEMKDYSELMIDLAYSAVLFNDQGLANEVLKLEERMDRLRNLLNMKVMLATRDAEEAEMGVGIANVAIATDKISDAAADIAYLVLQGFPSHRVVREAVREAKERVERLEISPESPLVDKTVEDLQSRFGVDVVAIQHKGRWMVNPEKIALKPDNVLIVRGSRTGVKRLKTRSVRA
jgi:uncharacterized protein with PhoU and TrkA domain